MYTFELLKLLFLPKFQLGIFGLSAALGFEDSDFTESTTEEITREETETERQTGSTQAVSRTDETRTATDVTDQVITGEQALSLLDEESQALLQGLLGDLAATGTTSELIGDIQDRALAAPERFEGLVDPIIANARSNLEQQLGVTMQSLARSAGSGQNSLVAQLGLEEAANVEREIADLSATLGLQVEGAVRTEQTQAIQTQVGAVQALADVLKGAEQVGTTTETTEAARQLSELLAGTTFEKERIDLKTITDLISEIESRGVTSGEGSTFGGSLAGSLGF